jgi:hypothetical protein
MQLGSKMEFPLGTLSKLEIEIGEEGDKLTLGLKGMLTKQIASQLGIDWMFASDTAGYGGIKDAALSTDCAFTDIELRLSDGEEGEMIFHPEKVANWRVFAIGGAGLGIQCKSHIVSDVFDVISFLQEHRSGFYWEISPRQQALFADEVVAEAKKEVADSLFAEVDEPTEPPKNFALDYDDRSHETRPRGGKRVRREARVPDEVLQ